MSEKFSLKWNDFHSNASKSFGAFRKEDYLHDVTLVSDDQHQVTAHKLVLSASSEYFKNIFKKTKVSNPFLCLDGISSTDLENILDYIYNGEVEIYQERLDRFLPIAQRFQVEGLLDGTKEEKKEEEEIVLDFEPYSKPNFDPPAKPKYKKLEKVKSDANTVMQLNTLIDSSDFSEIDQKLYENMKRNSDGTFSCKVCSKTAKDKTHMKYHVETHMKGLSYPCITCGKDFRSRNALSCHTSQKKCY